MFFAQTNIKNHFHTSALDIYQFLLTQQDFSRSWVKKYQDKRISKQYFTIIIIKFFYQFSTLNGPLDTFLYKACSEPENNVLKRIRIVL